MQNTSKQYDNIVSKCRNLFTNKMSDYGSAWRILRLPSLTDQIFIKAQRIRGLQQNEVQKINESQDSEFIGIINYCIMALIQIEKGENPNLAMDNFISLIDDDNPFKNDILKIIKENIKDGKGLPEGVDISPEILLQLKISFDTLHNLLT